MSYHKFSNLGKKFNSDLTGQLMEDIFDREYKDRPCNCNTTFKLADGRCLYDGDCQKAMIVYGLE